jgi:hypothetical protein
MGYSKTYWEYGSNAKASKVSVFSEPLTAGNFDAQNALRAAFEAAVDAVTLGNEGSEQFIANEIVRPKNPSATPGAQRENKWLVSCAETGGAGTVTFTIPCYDPALLAADGENMDATSDEYIALVAATEAFVQSNDGNAVTVTSIKFRARGS